MSRVLVRGKLRVDAQRAASKLRDHLLADPSTWLCEVVRTASMSSATAVDVVYDSDDVWVTFDGARWPVGFLETAASEVGVSSDGRESALEVRLRLFTLAMYAALGDEADAVEVFVRDDCDAIGASRLEAAGLEDPSKSRSAPRAAPKSKHEVRSITVHLERPTSLRTLTRLVTFAELPEVTRLRERWSPRSLPVTVNGALLTEAEPPSSWSHETPASTHLQLEYSASATELRVHFYERGVLLAVERASLPSGLPIELPVIVRADADDVPCNISRSRVQAELVRSVTDQALTSLHAWARRLADEWSSEPETQRGRQAHEILGRLTWGVAANPELMSSPLAFLLDVRLLVDVWGGQHSTSKVLGLRSSQKLYVCRNNRSFSPEARVLAGDLFRVGPSTLERLVFASAKPVKEIEDALREGLKRRAAALARPEEPFELAPNATHVLRTSVEVGGTRALIGLCRFGEREASLQLFVDGHVLETAQIPLPAGALAFDAIVRVPSSLQLTPGYDGVRRDSTFDWFVRELLEASTKILLDHRQDVAPEKLAEVGPLLTQVLRIPGHALAPLASWRVWRAVTGVPGEAERAVSSEQIRDMAKRDQVVRYVSPDVASEIGPQPAPLLVLSRRQARALAPFISPAALESHDEWAQKPRTSRATLLQVVRESALADSPTYIFERDKGLIAVGVGAESRVVRVRRNQVVRFTTAPANSKLAELEGLVLAIEEDAWMPAFVDRMPVLERLPDQLARALLTDPLAAQHLRSFEVRGLMHAVLRQASLDDELTRLARSFGLSAATAPNVAAPNVAARPTAAPSVAAPAAVVTPSRSQKPPTPADKPRIAKPDVRPEAIAADPRPPVPTPTPQAAPLRPREHDAAPSPRPTRSTLEELRHLLYCIPPIVRLVATESGPPVRFDPRENAIFVNLNAPTVKVLVERRDHANLAAAALNEFLRASSVGARDVEARWLRETLGRVSRF